MTWDQAINIGILLTGFLGVMLPLHLQNRQRTAQQTELLQRVWLKLKQHDRRTRQLRRRGRNVVQRLCNLEAEVSKWGRSQG